MPDWHVFEEGKRSFLFFPRSARLYELSKTAAEIMAELPSPFPQSGASSPLHAELAALVEGESRVAPPSPRPMGEPERPSCHTVSLYLAQNCNMACSYCWNKGGTFGGAPHLMRLEDAAAVTALITALVGPSPAQQVHVNFYGGEPLLNLPALRQVVLDLRREEQRLGTAFHFTIDTNGTLLSGEAARFLAQHFAHVSVSLDGRREIHDGQRPGQWGKRTWRRIVANLSRFERPDLLGLRGTLTLQADSYLDTFDELTSMGVRRIQLEYCHEPGYRRSGRYLGLIVPLERQLAELRQFAERYVDTISAYRSAGEIPFVSNLLGQVKMFRRGARSTRPCGAGINSVAVDSRGEVYPCIAFVSHKEFRMGRVGTPLPLTLHRSLRDFSVDRGSTCHECWLRYDCGGGCYATHCQTAANSCTPHADYCHATRSKAQVYLYAMALMQMKCPWHLEGAP